MGGNLSVLYILIGGVIGTLGRWYLGVWIQTTSGAGDFPLGTLLVNLSGSFCLGLIARSGGDAANLSPAIRDGLTVGLCGAFTTMSTFSYESVRLLGHGEYGRATLYMGLTLIGCLGAVVAGAIAGKAL